MKDKFMRFVAIVSLSLLLFACSCFSEREKKERVQEPTVQEQMLQDSVKEPEPKKIEIIIEKELLYDQHTLEDVYPYNDTTRIFQWDKIKEALRLVDSIQQEPAVWVVLQNRRNVNGEAPLARDLKRNAYSNLEDPYGVQRYQSIPLYLPNDLNTPERYGEDGSWMKVIEMTEEWDSIKVEAAYIGGIWVIPKKYVHFISDTTVFHKVICVDRTNQNIATIEKSGEKWLVRSMNPATTGVHNPPYAHETPLGLFVIQEKKAKMVYLVDGSTATGGFAPYASRFSNGGYVHGVPVNAPRTTTIEYSQTLGTTPRSHMCVRNATSHAKFVYDWAPVDASLVFVFD